MRIAKGSKMLLFRYSNYRRTNFIVEHTKVIQEYGLCWMLKAGKRSDAKKLNSILESGGYIILKSPISDGNKYFIGKFDQILENEPIDRMYPEYYKDFLNDNYDFSGGQWFRLTMLKELDNKYIASLIMQKDGKRILDVLNTTRTAVMFISTEMEIRL